MGFTIVVFYFHSQMIWDIAVVCFFAYIFCHYVQLLYLKDLLHFLFEVYLLVSLNFIFFGFYSILIIH